jgi:hypothetical protein
MASFLRRGLGAPDGPRVLFFLGGEEPLPWCVRDWGGCYHSLCCRTGALHFVAHALLEVQGGPLDGKPQTTTTTTPGVTSAPPPSPPPNNKSICGS